MKTTVALFMLVASLTANAQSERSLVLSYTDKESGSVIETTLSLTDIRKITFNADNGQMNITTNANGQLIIDEQQAWSATFSTRPTGIQTVETGRADRLNSVGTFSVYNAQGALVGHYTHCIPAEIIGTLPKGIYLVKGNKGIIKVAH